MMSFSKLNLKRVGYSVLCAVLMSIGGCKPTSPAEALATDYWQALAEGNMAAAYALLSNEDKTYIDLETFSAQLRAQPGLSFLRLSPGDAQVAQQLDVQIVKTVTQGRRGEVLLSVQVPDLDTWLGEDLVELLSSSIEGMRQEGLEAQLAAEKKLIQKLRASPTALPSKQISYILNIVKEKEWRITFPKWRAEAMLTSAKALSANKELQEAKALLDTLSTFPDKLDPITELTVLKEARRARRMLPYLAQVHLSGFERKAARPGCEVGAALQVENRGDFPVTALTGVIEFLGADDVATQQTVTLAQDGVLESQTSAAFELCLEPPENWTGKADGWVAWLSFSEDVYKTRIQ